MSNQRKQDTLKTAGFMILCLNLIYEAKMFHKNTFFSSFFIHLILTIKNHMRMTSYYKMFHLKLYLSFQLIRIAISLIEIFANVFMIVMIVMMKVFLFLIVASNRLKLISKMCVVAIVNLGNLPINNTHLIISIKCCSWYKAVAFVYLSK